MDSMKTRRNTYMLRLFREYDAIEKTGELDKNQILEYTKEIHSLVQNEDKKTESMNMTPLQFEQMFKVLDKDESGSMSPAEIPNLMIAYMNWLYEKQSKEQLEDLYTDQENTTETLIGDNLPWFKKTLKIMSSPQYELVNNIITIANLFTVFLRSLTTNQSNGSIKRWCIIQICINGLMLLEMLADFSIAGPVKAFKYHFRVWPESFCQLVNIVAVIIFFAGEENQDGNNNLYLDVKLLELIVFVRLLKLISLLNEIKDFVLIGETMKNLLQPLKYLLGILALILYFFAETGMILYGGKVTMNSPQIIHDSGIPDNYYLVNFNDMFSSIITLFVLMVVNNWMVIV